MLVSTPALEDPNFTETVVLLVHHSEEGSLGLFVNRPTWIDGSEAFPDLESLDEQMRTLYFGGPVQMTQLLILARSAESAEGMSTILDGVQLTADPTLVAEMLQPAGAELRVFAGHTAWAAGQLEAEIGEGYWRVVDGSAALVFSENPQDLWSLTSRLYESGLTAGR